MAAKKATPVKGPTITAAHKADLKAIQTVMRDLADEHDFCQTYYEAVDALNKRLNQPLEVGRDVKATVSFYLNLTNVRVDTDVSFPCLEDEKVVIRGIEAALQAAGYSVTHVDIDEVEISY